MEKYITALQTLRFVCVRKAFLGLAYYLYLHIIQPLYSKFLPLLAKLFIEFLKFLSLLTEKFKLKSPYLLIPKQMKSNGRMIILHFTISNIANYSTVGT